MRRSGDALLHVKLLSNVHLVSLKEGVLIIRPRRDFERQDRRKLAQLLEKKTGIEWKIQLSEQEGYPTLAQEIENYKLQQKKKVQLNPLIATTLKFFPNAVITEVHDNSLDSYGLPQHNETQ